MANRGYYSVIQYIPDPGRLEAVNVGVVLVVPETNSIAISTGLSDYTRLMNFFPGTDTGRLDTALDSLVNRLQHAGSQKAEIELLRAKLANEVRMTPLRAMKVTEKPSEALKKLRKELVDV